MRPPPSAGPAKDGLFRRIKPSARIYGMAARNVRTDVTRVDGRKASSGIRPQDSP